MGSGWSWFGSGDGGGGGIWGHQPPPNPAFEVLSGPGDLVIMLSLSSDSGGGRDEAVLSFSGEKNN